jgi:hypothetical protein
MLKTPSRGGHMHVYYDVRKVLMDAAKHCESIGDHDAQVFLVQHAKKFSSTALICRSCGHEWSL